MKTAGHTALSSVDIDADQRHRRWSEVLFAVTALCIVGALFFALNGVWPPPALRDIERGTMTTPQ